MMSITHCQLVAFLAVLYGARGQTTESLDYLGLNEDHYDHVIDALLPLLPVNGLDETLYDHSDHDEMVFLDKDCAKNASYADYLRRELLQQQVCLHENERVPGIVEDPDYYHFFLQWNASNADDCLNGVTIDFEAFCISKIEYEMIFHVTTSYECNPVGSTTWWHDDIDGYDGGGYSCPEFDTNNLIVYVVDTVVNLQHEHFDHIPNANKETLGTVFPIDDNVHGTHVAGSIVGKKFGVIRDPRVKLKACNGMPEDGDGPWSYIESCIINVRDDLAAEKASNPDTRAVINFSFTTSLPYVPALPGYEFDAFSGCSTTWSWHFQSINADGGIILAAAGNDDRDACQYYPACSGYALAVGAYDSSHTRSDYKDGGSNYGNCVDAWGPGSNIKSSLFADGEYGKMSGTSMATPIVSGLVGNLLMLRDGADPTTDEIISDLSDDDYSFPVQDCKSAQCNAFSISCDDYVDLELGLNGFTLWTEIPSKRCRNVHGLGVFNNAKQCAIEAIATPQCGAEDGTVSIRWSSNQPERGCGCCDPDTPDFKSSSVWSVLTYHHVEWRLDREAAQHCQPNKNLGVFDNAEQCASIALQTDACDTSVFVNVMWSGYSKTHSSWGCRCCKSDSVWSDHGIWTIKSYATLRSYTNDYVENNLLQECEGDCNWDSETCAGILECYTQTGVVPGCTGYRNGNLWTYCYDPNFGP